MKAITKSKAIRLASIQVEALDQFILKVNYKGLRVCNVLITTKDMKYNLESGRGTIDLDTEIVSIIEDQVKKDEDICPRCLSRCSRWKDGVSKDCIEY